MELSQEEQLTLFQALAKSEGQHNPQLWEKGAAFCLQHDKENPNTNGISQLRGYLHNSIDSQYAHFVGLDISPIDKWVSKGIEEDILNPRDKHLLHAEAILSQAIIYKEDRAQILSEKETRQEILNQIQLRGRGMDNKDRILRLVEIAEHKDLLKEGKNKELKDLKTRIRKNAQNGIAPSKEQSSQITDKEALRTARNVAKNKNPDELAAKAKKYAEIRNRIHECSK